MGVVHVSTRKTDDPRWGLAPVRGWAVQRPGPSKLNESRTMKPAIEHYKKGSFRRLALNENARRCIGLKRMGMETGSAEHNKLLGLQGLFWQNCAVDDYDKASEAPRRYDDDGYKISSLTEHKGFYADECREVLVEPVIMPIRVPRRMGKPGKHPRSSGSFVLTRSRILYGWGVLIDNKAAFARTVAPGMLSAAQWGEEAAESIAEQWRKDEATEAKKERLSELRSETMHMENAISNYQAKIDELRARQREVDDEIATLEEELEP